MFPSEAHATVLNEQFDGQIYKIDMQPITVRVKNRGLCHFNPENSKNTQKHPFQAHASSTDDSLNAFKQMLDTLDGKQVLYVEILNSFYTYVSIHFSLWSNEIINLSASNDPNHIKFKVSIIVIVRKMSRKVIV